jgi:hypothetical protein
MRKQPLSDVEIARDLSPQAITGSPVVRGT